MRLTEKRLIIMQFIYENKNTYITEIAKKLKMHPFSVKKITDVLIKNKIAGTEKRGKTIMLRLSDDYDVLYQVESYKGKDLKLVKTIKDVFSRNKNIIVCILFGSYARNSQTKDSDMDLLFIVNSTAEKKEIIKKCTEFSVLIGVEVSPVIMSRKSFLEALYKKEKIVTGIMNPSQRIIVFGIENFLRTIE